MLALIYPYSKFSFTEDTDSHYLYFPTSTTSLPEIGSYPTKVMRLQTGAAETIVGDEIAEARLILVVPTCLKKVNVDSLITKIELMLATASCRMKLSAAVDKADPAEILVTGTFTVPATATLGSAIALLAEISSTAS